MLGLCSPIFDDDIKFYISLRLCNLDDFRYTEGNWKQLNEIFELISNVFVGNEIACKY